MVGSSWRISDSQFQISFHLKGIPAYELQHLACNNKKASINQFCCSWVLSCTSGGEWERRAGELQHAGSWYLCFHTETLTDIAQYSWVQDMSPTTVSGMKGIFLWVYMPVDTVHHGFNTKHGGDDSSSLPPLLCFVIPRTGSCTYKGVVCPLRMDKRLFLNLASVIYCSQWKLQLWAEINAVALSVGWSVQLSKLFLSLFIFICCALRL